MFRRALSSLRVQAVIWTLLPLVIIIALVGSVGVYSYNQMVGRLLQDRDSALALVSAARLSQNLEGQAGVLNAMADQLGDANCFTRDGQFNQQLCFAAHNGTLQVASETCLLDNIDYLALAYPEGDVALTIQSVPLGNGRCEMNFLNNILGDNIITEPYFQVPQLQRESYFSDVLTPLASERPQVVIGVPITNDENRFIGVLLGGFTLEEGRLGDEIESLGVGTAYILDRNGRVIWHPEPELRGADWSNQAGFLALQNLQPNQSGAQTILSPTGASVVVGYAQVPTTGWGLLIEESWDDVLGPVRAFQWLILAALIVGMGLVMVIISSGTRRLTEPIKDLAVQAEQLALGELAGAVQGGSVQEIQALADSFNDMAYKVARYRAGMQQYVSAITQTQEEERKRIARELHDDTIQSLIALGRRLELLEQSLENPIDAAIQVYQLQQMLTRTVAEVRQFSRDLRPLLLEDLGLVAAIRQMLRESERRDNVTTSFSIEGDGNDKVIDDEITVAAYRIVQEALSNIHKHAEARAVDVRLNFGEQELVVTVTDDGKGFPVTETSDLARRGSFGLMGIRERAKLFGGDFDISSAERQGTTVTIRLPYTLAPERLLPEMQVV
jgi:signal transduction histidine kinase